MFQPRLRENIFMFLLMKIDSWLEKSSNFIHDTSLLLHSTFPMLKMEMKNWTLLKFLIDVDLLFLNLLFPSDR